MPCGNGKDVLPPERKSLIEASVAELGHPDAWREQLFPRETSPLTGSDFSSRPMPEVIAFLQSFQLQTEPVRQTIMALAEQLRIAVEQEPARFAEVADQFAEVRPIYVRRLLEGFDARARNDDKFVSCRQRSARGKDRTRPQRADRAARI